MKKEKIRLMPEYFDRYINLVGDLDILSALEKFGIDYLEQIRPQIEKLGDKVYAEGKWTAKDILQHILDSERIFAYRALRIARMDKTPLPGYEEDDYALSAKATRRPLGEILDELYMVRKTTIRLFKSFDEEMLLAEGICSEKQMSVLALGFVIAGHPIHHVKVLHERYFNL